ncbi:MAG: IS66 family transposase [Candidatus Bathyarchaeia archaeon]
MLWTMLLLVNLVWLALFVFCRLHIRLAHNSRVVVRRWKRRRAERRGRAKRGKKPGSPGGGRLSPAYDIVVEVTPRCHLTWRKGDYTRTVTDVLDGKPVNVLYVVHRRFCLLCLREAKPRIDGVMPGYRFGNNLIRYAVNLRVKRKLPLAEVSGIIHDTYRVEVTPQTIHNWCLKAADLSKPVYEGIDRLANRAEVLHLDETGMPVDGSNRWLWVKVTKNATVYRIYGNRGSEALKDLIEGWRGGTAVSDFYSTYSVIRRLVEGVRQQRSIPHLFRLVDKAVKEAESPEAEEIAQEVRGLFKLRSAREATQRLERLLERRDKTIKSSKPLRRLAKTLRRHRDQLFIYMDLGIDGTNNLAEREIRPFVIFRKRAQCFRSRASAEAHARLFTVCRTRLRNGQPWLSGIL